MFKFSGVKTFPGLVEKGEDLPQSIYITCPLPFLGNSQFLSSDSDGFHFPISHSSPKGVRCVGCYVAKTGTVTVLYWVYRQGVSLSKKISQATVPLLGPFLKYFEDSSGQRRELFSDREFEHSLSRDDQFPVASIRNWRRRSFLWNRACPA